MKYTVTLPALPRLLHEAGVIAEWRKAIGDAVLNGETLALVGETAIIAPTMGILTRKYVLVGEAIAVGEPLALLSGVPEPLIAPEDRFAVPPPAPISPASDEENIHQQTPQEREVARHNARSAQIAPHVFTVARVDLTEATRLAARVHAPLLPFVIHCVAAALPQYPVFNAIIRGEEIYTSPHVHIGARRRDGKGVWMTILRDADKRSLLSLSRELAEPTESQRGATFTLTESPAGVLFQSAILPQPHTAILTIGQSEMVPAINPGGENAVALRPLAHLCLTHDARAADNETAAAFLNEVKQALEQARFLFAD